MLPIRDTERTRRFPAITLLIIGANLVVFLYQLSLSPDQTEDFARTYGLIPARFWRAIFRPEFRSDAVFFPLISHMFLHAGWGHILANMWFLWVFGDNVEARMGRLGFLIFYLLSGLVAAFGQLLVVSLAPASAGIAMVGASGAISGVMAAYLVLFPRAMIWTLIPFFIFIVPLRASFVIGYWFLVQLISGLGSLGLGVAGGTAWFAHIGGFIGGLILVRLMAPRRQRGIRHHRYYDDEN